MEELAATIRRLKPGKSPGLDSILPEFILHAGSSLKSWFCDFLSSCMRQLKIPNIWRRALIVASLSQKSHWGTQSANIPYLCCVFPLKSSKDSSTHCSLGSRRTFDTGGNPAFQLKRRPELCLSTSQQPTTLYGTVASGRCKLLRLLPDRHMVRMIMEMVGNRSFTLTTGNGKRSRLRRLKNGVPQDLSWRPFSSTSNFSDLPTTVSRKYACADGTWQP